MKRHYQTTNLSLAAFIVVNGHEMQEPFLDGDTVVFTFSLTEEEEDEMKHTFFNRKGVVSARNYSDTEKKLKQIVHQLRG